MNFPAQPPEPWPPSAALDEAMGAKPQEVLGHVNCIAVYESESRVRALTPYWAKRLGKESLEARRISCRGGELSCRLRGERVLPWGRAVKYLEGVIEL